MYQSGEFIRCRYCGGRIVLADKEFVCSSCGVIYGSDEFIFIKDRDAKQELKEIFLGSFMGPKEIGRKENYRGMERSVAYMKKLADNLSSQPRKRIEYVAKVLARLGEMLQVPYSVVVEAQMLSEKMLRERDLMKGTLVTLSAYCMVLACRRRGIARSWGQVKEAMKQLGYDVRLRHVIHISTSTDAKSSVNPENYLLIIAKRLAYNNIISSRIKGNREVYVNQLFSRARELVNDIPRRMIDGYSPYAIALTLVYLSEAALAKKESRKRYFDQDEFSSILNASIYTLREQAVKLRRWLQPEYSNTYR